jgi:hypothetical protein
MPADGLQLLRGVLFASARFEMTKRPKRAVEMKNLHTDYFADIGI